MTLSEMRERPHWSYSSVNQLLNICSLQWFFEKIVKLPRAYTPASLSFGSAFHRTTEWFNTCRKEGHVPSKAAAVELFTDLWARQVEEDGEIKYSEGEDAETCAKQGRDLVACYADFVDPAEEVIDVNTSFAAPVPTSEKPIIGEIDLVARKDGQVIVADQKTSARRWPSGQADRSLQPTVYLFGYSQIHPEHADASFRFDVVTKTKVPAFEQYVTRRSVDDMTRLFRLIERAESIVEHELFYPSDQSMFCNGCPFREPCRAWHRNQARLVSVAA